MIQNRVSLFIAVFLLAGIFFLATPKDGHAGFQIPATTCCQWVLDGEDQCITVPSDLKCRIPIGAEDFAVFGGQFCNESIGMCTAELTRAVPTLSEWGLIAMAGVLGFIGFIAIRRKKVAA